MSRNHLKTILIVILFACDSLTGCGATTPSPISQLPDTPTISPAPSATPILSETPTPTPTPPRPPTAIPTSTPVPRLIRATTSPPTPTVEPRPGTAMITPLPATATQAEASTATAKPTPSLTTYVRELVVVATEPETLIALTDDGRLLRSTDGGHHTDSDHRWEVVYTGENETRPRAIGLDYQPPHTLYLLTRQGLYRSSDYGDTFEFVHGLRGTAVSVAYENAAHLWVGGGDEPMMKSEDGGQHWRSASIGLSAYRLASPIFINPRDGNMLLVITQGRHGGAALYRGTREGAWTRLPGPTWLLPTGNNPIGLAWDNDQRILYTGDADGKLYCSLNVEALDQATVTWEVSHHFDPPRLPIVLAMGQGPALYLTLYDYWTNSGPLLRGVQTESGWSWQEIPFPKTS